MTRRPYRWPCGVIGCERTVGSDEPYREDSDWGLCSKHWPMVPRDVKRVIRRKERLMLKYRGALQHAEESVSALHKSLPADLSHEQLIRLRHETERRARFRLLHRNSIRAYLRIMDRVIARLNDRAVGL